MNCQEKWLDFMMKFELGLEKPDSNQPLKSAFAIGSSYFVGGLIPLIPYMVVPLAGTALIYSVLLTAVTLFAFGAAKVHNMTGFCAWRWFLLTSRLSETGSDGGPTLANRRSRGRRYRHDRCFCGVPYFALPGVIKPDLAARGLDARSWESTWLKPRPSLVHGGGPRPSSALNMMPVLKAHCVRVNHLL